MNITYRHQVYTVDPCTLIVRESGFYARIEVAGRVPMVAYVKVDPRETGMVYDQPAIPQNFDSGLLHTVEPSPQPLTVVVTPEMAQAISHTSGVEIVVRKTVTVSLWHTEMRPAA